MSLESALYSYLSNEATITAIVGTQIYAHMATEGATLPRIIYTSVSRQAFDHLTAPSGVVSSRMQIDSYAITPDGAIDLAEAVRVLLHGYRGQMGTEALEIRWSTLDTQRNNYESPHDDSSVGVHRASQDYMIVHHETIPTF